jgi:hypothetical protein
MQVLHEYIDPVSVIPWPQSRVGEDISRATVNGTLKACKRILQYGNLEVSLQRVMSGRYVSYIRQFRTLGHLTQGIF